LVEQLEGERRGFAVGRSGGCASGSSSMDLLRIEEMNTIDDVRMQHASHLESAHSRR
jgi:hypothetical protein